MNRRRHILALMALSIGLAALDTHSQTQARLPRLGYLATSSPATNSQALEEFRGGLRELGWIEGRNIAIEYRWTDESVERLPQLAAELVSLKIDVIVAWTTPVVIAARQASSTIPIVMVGIADPVGSGFAASLARPGGNITGLSNLSRDLSGKLVELLLQVVPRGRRFAALRNPANPSSAMQLKETEAAARLLGLQLQLFDIRTPADLEGAFAEMAKARLMGVVFFPDTIFISQRKRIAGLAMKHRLPTIFGRRENADAGGLIAYGPSLSGQFRQAAMYVDKILKGARPGDLPVEQPSKLELVINRKTAKALGITVPQELLLRADEVIE